jgi:hypothetical protein
MLAGLGSAPASIHIEITQRVSQVIKDIEAIEIEILNAQNPSGRPRFTKPI